MEFKVWKDGIKNCFKELADLDYQQQAWFGLIPDVFSGYGELLCRLYDDYDFGHGSKRGNALSPHNRHSGA